MDRSNKRITITLGLAILTAVALATTAIAAPGGNGKGKGGKGKPAPAPTVTEEPPPPPTTDANAADAEFVRMMIPHHHQALVMSGLATNRTGDGQMLALAGRIDAEQTVEIGTMQSWQAASDLAVSDAEQSYAMMMQNPMMIEMMGMATQAELDQLAASTGDDFDALYLQLMIAHHQGAVRMIVDVLTDGSDPVLAQLAGDMLNTQTVQIDMMEQMLTERGAA